MPTYNIAVSEVVYLLLKEEQHSHEMTGKKMSISRLLDYLVNLGRIVRSGIDEVAKLEPDEQLKAWPVLLMSAATYEPPVRPRGQYRPSRYATIEQRATALQELIVRLGFQPSHEMVNEYLDRKAGDRHLPLDDPNRSDAVIRNLALSRLHGNVDERDTRKALGLDPDFTAFDPEEKQITKFPSRDEAEPMKKMQRLLESKFKPPDSHPWSFVHLTDYVMANGDYVCSGALEIVKAMSETIADDWRGKATKFMESRLKRRLTDEDLLAIWFATGFKPTTNPIEP